VGVYVERLGLRHISRSIYFFSLGGKVLGDLVNVKLSERLGRIRTLQLCFISSSALLFCFLAASSAPSLLLLAAAQNFFVDIIWCNMYTYLAEAFPTSVRSSAFGISMGVGRSGAVVSTALGGVLPALEVAFALYGGAFFLGGLLCLCFKLETSGRSLADVV